MWSRRVERINELLLQEISRMVTERQDPDIGFVTFTGVQITEDLMEAKVFYSVLGSEEDRERTAAALHHYKFEIRRSMRRLESLRRIPDFHFIFDDTLSRAARVNELLEQIHREDAPAPSVQTSVEPAPPALPSAEIQISAEPKPTTPKPNGRRSPRKKA